MSNHKSVKYLLSVIICLFFIITGVTANSLFSLKINQYKQSGENIKIYFEAESENGERIINLIDSNIDISLKNDKDEKFELIDVMPFVKTDESIAYIFLIDISGSVGEPQFENIRSGLLSWVEAMDSKNQVALFTYGEQVSQISNFTNNKDTLKELIANLKNTDNDTKLYNGIVRVAEMLKVSDVNLPDRKAVMIFTNGRNIRSSYTRDEAVHAISEANIPFYAVTVEKENSRLADLGSIMRTSNGDLFYIKENQNIAQAFEDIHNKMLDIYVARAVIPSVMYGGGEETISFVVSIEDRAIEEIMEVKIAGFSEAVLAEETEVQGETEPSNTLLFIAIFSVPILGAVFVGVFLIIRHQKKPKIEQKNDSAVAVSNLNQKMSSETVGLEDVFKPYSGDSETQPFFNQEQSSVILDITEKNTESGEQKRYKKPLNSELKIGRDSSCEIIIGDDTVSRLQCVISFKLNKIYIINKSHANKTVLNGEKLGDDYKEIPQNSAIIKMGKTEMTIWIEKL